MLPLCLLLSCTDNDTITTVQDVQEVLIDSIALTDIDSDAELSYGQNKPGHLTISYYNSKRNNIHTYDVDNKHLSTIEINPEKAGREFYLADDTTLYILNGKGNYITIVKNAKYRYAHAAQNDTLPATLYSMYMPFQVKNKRVLVQKTLYWDLRKTNERKAIFKRKLLYLCAVEQDSLINIDSFGAFPEEYINTFHYELFPKTAYNTTKQEVYYLFNNSNTIFQYNIKTKKVSTYAIKGLQKNNQKPFDQSKITDLSYAQEYMLENSQYYIMLYDNIQDRLAVIQKIGIPGNNAKGELNLFTDQPYQVYTINKKYDVEKIFRFEKNNSHKFPFAYCHNGLLYVPARDVRHNNGKNELIIYVYKIS